MHGARGKVALELEAEAWQRGRKWQRQALMRIRTFASMVAGCSDALLAVARLVWSARVEWNRVGDPQHLKER